MARIRVAFPDYGITTACVTEPVRPLPSFTVSVMLYVPEVAHVFDDTDPTCVSLLPLPQSQVYDVTATSSVELLPFRVQLRDPAAPHVHVKRATGA